MRTRIASPSELVSRRVASMPSRRGMRMSMRTIVGAQAARLVDGLAAVGGLADHLDVRRRLQQLAKARADQRLVVGDEDARAHASGRRAWIAKPPPSRAPVSRRPP